jgi:hypothetical protein
MLPLEEGERVNAVLPVREYADDRVVFFATRRGIVKKTPLSAFSNQSSNGIWAIHIDEGDELVNVALTDGAQDIMLFSSSGKCIRFQEARVRTMGRTARGVIGIRVAEAEQVQSMLVVGEGDVLTATENGFGKRTAIGEFPVKGRGGMGVIGIQTSERNGALVGALQVTEEDDIMLISDGGTLVRMGAWDVSSVGRNTQGVTLAGVAEVDRLLGLGAHAIAVARLRGHESDREELEVVALRAALRNRDAALLRLDLRVQAIGRVAARAHVALERDRGAVGTSDPERAIDELLAVVGPAALVVWLARHHHEALVDVAPDLEHRLAALRAAPVHELIEPFL